MSPNFVPFKCCAVCSSSFGLIWQIGGTKILDKLNHHCLLENVSASFFSVIHLDLNRTRSPRPRFKRNAKEEREPKTGKKKEKLIKNIFIAPFFWRILRTENEREKITCSFSWIDNVRVKDDWLHDSCYFNRINLSLVFLGLKLI